MEKDEEAAADEDRDKRSTIGVQWEVGQEEQLVVCGAGHERLWVLMGGGFRDRKKR